MLYGEMIIAIGNLSHKKFLEIYRIKNNGTRIKTTTDTDWIKKHGTDQVDLAKLNYSELPSDWQKERWYGAKIALDALYLWNNSRKPLNDEFIEHASNLIHDDWLKRNFERAKAEHKLSYSKLSEEAKDKDRIFAKAAVEIYQKNT